MEEVHQEPAHQEQTTEQDSGKKGRIPTVVVVGIVIAAIAVGVLVYIKNMQARQLAAQQAYEAEQARLTLIYEDRQLAQELKDAIESTKFHFMTMEGMYPLLDDFQETIFLTRPEYVSYIQAGCSKEITEARSERPKVDALYEQFTALACEEEETQELNEAVNDLYDAFCERYEVLIEGNIDIYDFSGDYAPIKERYTEARNHYGEALRALDVEDPDVLPDSAAEAETESE